MLKNNDDDMLGDNFMNMFGDNRNSLLESRQWRGIVDETLEPKKMANSHSRCDGRSGSRDP